jgi:hypothetical protein
VHVAHPHGRGTCTCYTDMAHPSVGPLTGLVAMPLCLPVWFARKFCQIVFAASAMPSTGDRYMCPSGFKEPLLQLLLCILAANEPSASAVAVYFSLRASHLLQLYILAASEPKFADRQSLFSVLSNAAPLEWPAIFRTWRGQCRAPCPVFQCSSVPPPTSNACQNVDQRTEQPQNSNQSTKVQQN